MIQLDSIDIQLLKALQADSRASNAQLARQVQLSPSGLQKRLRRLETANYINAYTALLDRKKLGLNLQCFVHVSMRHDSVDSADAFQSRMRQEPNVLECYRLTGEDDYLLKLIVDDVEHLQQLLRDLFVSSTAVRKHRTSIVLQEIKATTSLPLPKPRD